MGRVSYQSPEWENLRVQRTLLCRAMPFSCWSRGWRVAWELSEDRLVWKQGPHGALGSGCLATCLEICFNSLFSYISAGSLSVNPKYKIRPSVGLYQVKEQLHLPLCAFYSCGPMQLCWRQQIYTCNAILGYSEDQEFTINKHPRWFWNTAA